MSSEKGERPASPVPDRAEELMREVEERFLPLARRALALAIETAEDIWAEAQEIRRRRAQDRPPE